MKNSTVVNKLSAGMSQLFAKIVKLFFNTDGLILLTNGVNLPVGPGDAHVRLFTKLGMFIQDGGAHKSTWHCRGDGAIKM